MIYLIEASHKRNTCIETWIVATFSTLGRAKAHLRQLDLECEAKWDWRTGYIIVPADLDPKTP